MQPFQSDLAVYHDDYGDYSTNEPTMDGTASLIYLLAAKENESDQALNSRMSSSHGGIIRGDSSKNSLHLFSQGMNLRKVEVLFQKHCLNRRLTLLFSLPEHFTIIR